MKEDRDRAVTNIEKEEVGGATEEKEEEERVVAEVTLISQALDEIGRVQRRRDNSQDGTTRTTEWEITAVGLWRM